MTTALLIIDPQNDFLDHPKHPGSLAIPGSYDDMLRLANHIKTHNPDAIYVTMDTHQLYDISHPSWWRDENGDKPEPFTIISLKDIEDGKWVTTDKNEMDYSKEYVRKLEEQNRYQLCIWPYHVIKGTLGHQVVDVVKSAITEWETKKHKKAVYIYKGENPRTEHYSGFKAEVELEDDKSTMLNVSLLDELNTFSKVEVAGEALSHCVGNSILDMLSAIPSHKITLLKDCSTSVVGFEKDGERFVSLFEDEGVEVITTNDYDDLMIKKNAHLANLYKQRNIYQDELENDELSYAKNALDNASRFVLQAPLNALDFEFGFSDNGEVNIFYENEDKNARLHVFFDEDNSISYYANMNGKEIMEDVNSLDEFKWSDLQSYVSFVGLPTSQPSKKPSPSF